MGFAMLRKALNHNFSLLSCRVVIEIRCASSSLQVTPNYMSAQR